MTGLNALSIELIKPTGEQAIVKSSLNSLSSERILSIFDRATLKNYISAVIYSSISSYTSLERAKIKLSEKKYFGLRETIIFCTKKINKAYF